MKRKLTVLLTIVCLLATILPACKSGGESSVSTAEAAGEPLRVLVDVEFASSYIDPAVDAAGSSLISNIKLSGGKIGEVQFEYLPQEGEARAAALTHMQTEVMTGKGPDLFICACSRPGSEENALFRFPTQVMDRKLFLPLDELIAEAKFTDFDRLAPMIMEQGRNEEGQQLVPLAFTVPMTVFRKSEVKHEHSKTMTRADMLAGEDYLRESAVVTSMTAFMSTGFKELADYENETLCFSEEELREYLMDYYELSYSEDRPEVPAYYTSDLAVDFIESINGDIFYGQDDLHFGLRREDELTLVPVYSKDGGYVAYITSFAAINRNTKKAKEAFALLDYLLSSYGARSELYGCLTHLVGMPVNMDLGTADAPISTASGYPWALTDENYQEYCSLRDNISDARFSTPLEVEITEAYADIGRSEYKKSQGEPAEEPEKIIADAYRVMKMELAES